MPFDLNATLNARRGENYKLHSNLLNSKMVRVLTTIGYDRYYERAEGCYLIDREGDRYLDFLSGFGVFAVGRNHPVVKRALSDVLEADLASLVQMDCSLLAGLLGEALLERAPDRLSRCFFANSGAEAIEGAMKFARYATGRQRILYCDHAFHGLTYGALSLNGDEQFREGFGPLLPGCDAIPFGDAEALERELARGDVAAFFVEPIQGHGVNVPADDYLPAVQDLCRRFETLFVADEIQTGLGRTGRFHAFEHWGVEPDIVTLAKGLSGGYAPVGAILCREDIFDKVFHQLERAVVHGSTFSKNPLAMAAGLATLNVIEEERLVERAAHMGERFRKGLEPLLQKYEIFQEIRGKGLMIGFGFGEPNSLGLKMGWKALETALQGLFSQLVTVPLFQRHRILSQVAAHRMNVVKILPPLVVGEEEVDYFLASFDDVLADCHRYPGTLWDFSRTLVKAALNRHN
ncbi:aspartate aminotransferase family protein [Myxococcota bacterium]|nr:aspartate aminotransferase family protein [Myxococcota bacterium]